MLTGTPLESGGRKSKERQGGKEGRKKRKKSDGRVKAEGFQRGGENRGGRIDREGKGGTTSRSTRQNETCLLSPSALCKWMAPAILPSATYLGGPKVGGKKGHGKRRERSSKMVEKSARL